MRNRVAKISLCILLGLSLAACERAKGVVSGQSGYAYEGYVFKGKLQRDSDDRANFSVTVRGASRGVQGALEAGRIAANRYCIAQYGNSDITWTGQSPDSETETVELLDGGTLAMNGRCKTW